MQQLWSLEDFSVEEGAVPNLKTLKIECCDKMRKFPHGLLQLKKLQPLNLYDVSQELMSEVLKTQGEDWNRIGLIISQTLETYLGTKMVSFVVYLNLSLILYQDPFVS